jgi:hypothetical protein
MEKPTLRGGRTGCLRTVRQLPAGTGLPEAGLQIADVRATLPQLVIQLDDTQVPVEQLGLQALDLNWLRGDPTGGERQ